VIVIAAFFAFSTAEKCDILDALVADGLKNSRDARAFSEEDNIVEWIEGDGSSRGVYEVGSLIKPDEDCVYF
jgi:hypothetical protein